MNKIIKRFAIALSVCLIFTLTACGEDYIKPSIQVDNAHALRTSIDFDFTIFDEDDMLVGLTIVLTGEHDGEEYTDTKTVNIYGGEYEEDDETEEEVFIGEKKENTFTGLLVDHTYELTLTGTYDEKSRNMLEDKSISLTTSSVGSKEEPHKVGSIEDLNNVRLDVDGYFELTKSIDCKVDGEASELKPFFTSSKKFTGNFDGGGFIISNFYQDSYEQDLGLFGYIGDAGVVKNLEVNGVKIHSTRYTDVNIGGFAGTNTGTIADVKMSDITITTKGPDEGQQFVGGFVGANKDGGTITNVSVSNVSIALNAPNNARVGGFVGTNISSTKNSVLTNVSVKDAEVLVQIPSEPNYSADDEDVELVLNVGGFAGDNRGVIETASTNANVAVYVEGTKTASDLSDDTTTTTDSNDYADYTQTQRHNAISKMTLNIGGFVGANLSGSINGGQTTTEDIIVEVAFLNYLRFGGFVGYNDYSASIVSSEYEGNGRDYIIVVGEDTVLNGETNGTAIDYIGYVVGLNNNPRLDNNDIINSNSTVGIVSQFTFYRRYAEKNEVAGTETTSDTTTETPEYLYTFKQDTTVKVNTFLK